MGKRIDYFTKYGFIEFVCEFCRAEPSRLRAMIKQRCRPSRIDWSALDFDMPKSKGATKSQQ